jgi:hypothetical protein
VFQLFLTYFANVSSRCCKSRSGVAYVAIELTCRCRLLQLLGRRAQAVPACSIQSKVPTCAWELKRVIPVCEWRAQAGRRVHTTWARKMREVQETERCTIQASRASECVRPSRRPNDGISQKENGSGPYAYAPVQV